MEIRHLKTFKTIVEIGALRGPPIIWDMRNRR